MRAAGVVVVGSANTDLVVRVDEFPQAGQTVDGGALQVIAGGKGANQAVAAARCGARVTFIGSIARDAFGNAAIRGLRAERIETRFIRRDTKLPSGAALILVNRSGENLIAVSRSSNHELAANDIDRAEVSIWRAKCLVVQLEVPLAAVRRAVEIANRFEVPLVFNPAPAPAKPLSTSLLRKVTWLTPNESELATLTGQSVRSRLDVERAARKLLGTGVKEVLVTCGAQGVCRCYRGGVDWFPAPCVKAVDTVGAGDCFTGAFAAAVARKESVEAAITFAVRAATISVTRHGAQPSFPGLEEI